MHRRPFLLSMAAMLASPPLARAAATRAVVDQLGRHVQVPATVRRIVALQHQSLDILMELGASDRLVGILRNWRGLLPGAARIDPGLARLPAPGDLTSVNVEALLALRPDVVFVTNYAPAPMIAKMAQVGVPVVAISLEKGKGGPNARLNPQFTDDDAAYTQGLKEGVRLIGTIVGEPARAQRLLDAAFAGRHLVEQRVSAIPEGRRVRLYMANPDLQTYGSGKYTGVMMARAGGINVARGMRGWARVSMEDVLRWDPQVIFVQERYASVADQIKASPAWQPVAAVRSGRIYVTPEYVKPWGYPLPEALALGEPWMAKKLYPARFADYDLQAAADRFYRAFYGVSYVGPN